MTTTTQAPRIVRAIQTAVGVAQGEYLRTQHGVVNGKAVHVIVHLRRRQRNGGTFVYRAEGLLLGVAGTFVTVQPDGRRPFTVDVDNLIGFYLEEM